MLAEWETRDLHAEAFDMTYAWELERGDEPDRDRARAMSTASTVYYSQQNEGLLRADAMRMTFVSNHDKNAWEGTEFERFGDGLEAAIVLSVVSDGMPLIYNGQEAGNDRRLKFFEKDPIAWQEHPRGDLYAGCSRSRRRTRRSGTRSGARA